MTRFPDASRWAGLRVLVTGNTGFKGSWLSCWLDHLGAQVRGLSLPEPPTEPCLWAELGGHIPTIEADLRAPGWQEEVARFGPDVVFHLAAQSIVAEGYRRAADTFDTNVMGTAHLLQALAGAPRLRAFVVVTTDKVYDPRQSGPYAEEAYLGGADPYAASKAATELLCASWPDRSLPLVTARAGNVVGGGDWSAERLVPDLVRAWSAGLPLVLRDPHGVRPWQHVLEPLRGYLLYAESVMAGEEVPRSLNFGPGREDMVPVGELVEFCATLWRGLHPGAAPQWEVAASRQYAETGVLTIASDLADAQLDWRGVMTWQETMSRTLSFYSDRAAGRPVRDLVQRDLAAYTAMSGRSAP